MYPHNTIRRKERIVLVLGKRGWAETVVVVSKKKRGGSRIVNFFPTRPSRFGRRTAGEGVGATPGQKKHESKSAFLHLISPEF